MALFDIFGIGSSADYLSGFMSEEERRKLQQRAGQNALLQSGLAMLANSGYSRTPVSLGQILGAGGQAGLQAYQGTLDQGAQNVMTQQRLQEMKRKQDLQNRTQEMLGSIQDPQERLYAELAPEQYVAGKLKPRQTDSPFAKIDPKDYTKESFAAYVRTGDITQLTPLDKTKEPNMTDEASRVSFALFNKLPNELTSQEMGKVNQYIENQRTRVAQAGVPSSQPAFENAAKLRTEYNSQPAVKAFGEVQNAFDQIKSGLSSVSAAGDLAAATKFMKLLDPGSVVRESELGMAMAATGVLDRANNYFQRLSSGQKLTPSQRKDFLDVSTKLYNAAKNTKNKLDTRYAKIARQGALDPELVIGRSESDIMKEYGL